VIESFKRVVLRLMRVPAEPRLPAGDPRSARVFRAGLNYWRLRCFWWGVHQVLTFAFFVVMVTLLHHVPDTVTFRQGRGKNRLDVPVRIAGAIVIARGLEMVSWGLWLVQMPLTFALARLDYEMRWYVVTDRAARLRDGILKVNEMTFTLVNVQDIRIRQGPLQRLLGLADVELRTAGGSEKPDPASGQGAGPNLHLARFRGVDNAEAIRDLVRTRMKEARDAGLGDPDDGASHIQEGGDIVEALETLRRESKALRAVAQQGVS
jgi:hypothetical protein